MNNAVVHVVPRRSFSRAVCAIVFVWKRFILDTSDYQDGKDQVPGGHRAERIFEWCNAEVRKLSGTMPEKEEYSRAGKVPGRENGRTFDIVGQKKRSGRKKAAWGIWWAAGICIILSFAFGVRITAEYQHTKQEQEQLSEENVYTSNGVQVRRMQGDPGVLPEDGDQSGGDSAAHAGDSTRDNTACAGDSTSDNAAIARENTSDNAARAGKSTNDSAACAGDSISGSIAVGETDIYFLKQEANEYESGERRQAILAEISGLTDADYQSAVSYEENHQKDIADSHVVFMNESASGDAAVYGYVSEGYDTCGIIVRYEGQEDCFDYFWWPYGDYVEIYEGDYDLDGTDEICLCMKGTWGTGISIERLVILEKESENRPSEFYEFCGETQREEIRSNLNVLIDTDGDKIVVQKSDGSGNIIFEWMSETTTGHQTLGVDCYNQIEFEVQGDRILMYIDVGIRFEGMGITYFLPEEEGKMCFEVIYSEEGFCLK